MNTKASIVAILDDARRTSDFKPLMLLLYSFLRGDVLYKHEIVQDALVEISGKLRAGETSISLAPKLRGFLNICFKRLRDRQIKAESRLAYTDEELYDVVAPETSDPAIAIVRREEVRAEVALLMDMRQNSPRQFAALVADFQGIPITEHFEEKLGEKITSDNSRKLRERAKQKLEKGSEKIRKDSSS
jgi:hypothetical protein